MKNVLLSLAIFATLAATACKNDNAATTTASSSTSTTSSAQTAAAPTGAASSLTPEELGSLGAQIKKQPNDADRLLKEKGLDEQSFGAAVRKVSENPADAKRYTAAYRSAS
jgi:hypothetical protein